VNLILDVFLSKMLKATKELITIVEKRASERDSWSAAQECLRQGADITAPTSTGPMIHCVIAEEKRHRLATPRIADNCQHLIEVLQQGASDRLTAQVFAANGGDLIIMQQLAQLKASCYQSTRYGPLGLMGSLLKQESVPIRLDVVRFFIENDPETKQSLTIGDHQQQTLLSLAKNNPICPQSVIDYIQRQFDNILNQIAFVQPQIDPDEVIMWIHRGANTEAIDKDHNTVLSNAVVTDNIKLVRALVSAGSNTAHRNGNDLTPLEIAKKAIPRNPPLIAILETQEINAKLQRLIEAKQSQLTTEEVYALLENGANINARMVNNDSLLHLLVAQKGTPEMLTAFVSDFNADLSVMNADGYRPIELCILLDEDPFVYLHALFKLPEMTVDFFNNSRLNKTLLEFAVEQNRLGAEKTIQKELNCRLWNCMRCINTEEDNFEVIMAELTQLTACGAHIDHRYRDDESRDQTVLHYACEKGAQRSVQYMIEHLHADYSLQNHDGDYPITIAAGYGHLPIVEYLRSLPNSKLTVFNNDQQTPLHLATKNHHLLVVRYLVRWGADHLARNLSQQTPLDIARTNVSSSKEEEMNDTKLIHFLEQLICPTVEHSAQESSNATNAFCDLETCELMTPMVVNPIHVITVDTDDTLGKQSRGLFAGIPNNNLREAARKGSLWEAQKAIGQGADIRHQQGTCTPYEQALISGKQYSLWLTSTKLILVDRSAVEAMVLGCQQIAHLLEQIAQTKLVEAIDQSNSGLVKAYHIAGAPLTTDLLYRACHASDNVEIVDYLIEQSAHIYQTLTDDSSSDSPYRIAKRKKFPKLATYLKYRLSLECTKAVKENSLESVKRLVNAGANVDMHHTNNLSVALQHQNTGLIQFLCENGAKMPAEWCHGKTIVLEPIVSQQLKPEIVFRINQCLINRRLRLAAASGNIDAVIQCQHLGADINSTNCRGSTALLYAIQYGNCFRVVHALVSRGASMLHTNEDEPTPLIDLARNKDQKQIARYLSEELNKEFLSAVIQNHRQVAEKLAKLGVDFNYQDEQKRTALHYAVQFHGVDLVNWLCECGSVPTIADINGDYPMVQATEKGKVTNSFNLNNQMIKYTVTLFFFFLIYFR
jgi:ankyrin repeat protein